MKKNNRNKFKQEFTTFLITMQTIFLVLTIVAMASIKFSTSHTSLRWNKRSKNFDVILNSTTRETEIYNVTLKREHPKLRNFNGQPLRICHYEEHGIFEYYENDTKIKGICGEIWTTICSFLNFTMVLSKDPLPFIGESLTNGTYTGILKKAFLNETDVVPHLGMFLARFKAIEYSTVLWTYSVRIYSRGHWKRNPAWMFDIFTSEVWITILVLLVILSIARITIQRILIRYRGKSLEAESIPNHLFYNFSTLCNQPGCSSEKTGSGSNLLNVVVVLFAYLTLAAFNSHLIFSLARESFAAPFHDVDSLMNKTKYFIMVLNGTTAHRIVQSDFAREIFGPMRRSSRFKVIHDVKDLYAYVCNFPDKYVFLDTDDVFAVRGSMECDVEPVGQAYTTTPIASGFSHYFQPSKSVNFWLVKFREFGLLDAIKKRYMTPTRKKMTVRLGQSSTIDMDHVSMIFCVLAFGIFASVIICIAENIIFIIKRRQSVKLTVKKVSNFKQRNVTKSIVQNCVKARYRK